MENKVYDQHSTAFNQVSAYVVLNGAKELVATVAFKFPKDGSGRLYCYLHIHGVAMVRGFANGYGYDKISAAAGSAVKRIVARNDERPTDAATRETILAMQAAIKDSGYSWDRELENAGFTVFQAV